VKNCPLCDTPVADDSERCPECSTSMDPSRPEARAESPTQAVNAQGGSDHGFGAPGALALLVVIAVVCLLALMLFHGFPE
jgi:hypothetical protein